MGSKTGAKPAPWILAVDDDPQFLRILEHHIRSWNFRVESVSDKGQLFRRLAEGRPSLMLLDVRFGEHDGLEVLRQVLAEDPGLRVIMLTAYGSIENAIAAIKFGAIDYLAKPIDPRRLRAAIELADKDAATTTASPAVRTAGNPRGLSRPILGESAVVRELLARIERVATSDSTVLVLGESGTGKELAARAIHELSPRRGKPFVALNVAALPRELVESTLFGHAKGAFTGADRTQSGCCEVADGGTLFLDEIGEMEVGLQAKLLRFLQERAFQRVGESQPIEVDVRIVAATNRDPQEQVARGQLRADLFYRLNVVPIMMPPLRARIDDIPTLVHAFLDRYSTRCGRAVARFTESALEELSNHTWPGNVRELENLVERLALLTNGPRIEAESVRAELCRTEGSTRQWIAEVPHAPTLSGPSAPAPSPQPNLRPIDRIEYEAIADALARARGNVRLAAKELGLGQATVYRKIKKYGLS